MKKMRTDDPDTWNRTDKHLKSLQIQKSQGLPIEQINQALIDNEGNIHDTSLQLRMTYAALVYRIEKSKGLQETIFAFHQQLIDLAQKNLKVELLQGSWRATHFVLKTLGRSRGFIEREDQNAPPTAQPDTLDLSSLSISELKTISELLAKTVDQPIDITPTPDD